MSVRLVLIEAGWWRTDGSHPYNIVHVNKDRWIVYPQGQRQVVQFTGRTLGEVRAWLNERYR